MSYFHPRMSDWTEDEKRLARRLDEECWQPLQGLYEGEKATYGLRRQRSLEFARYRLGSWNPNHERYYANAGEVISPPYYPETSAPLPSYETLNRQKGKSKMSTNHSLSVFLINRDVRGIECVYDYETDGKTPKNGQTYIFKTLDQSIKVGDYVVVPTSTRVGFTVVQVRNVDVEPDYDSNIDYKWAVCKVEKADYDAILEKEKDAVEKIKKAEKLRARKDLAEKLFDSKMEDMKSLPLYKNGDGEVAGSVTGRTTTDQSPVTEVKKD